MSSPEACSAELQSLPQEREHEIFDVIFLDQQHRIICVEELFRGTINQSEVYPREIAKQALHYITQLIGRNTPIFIKSI